MATKRNDLFTIKCWHCNKPYETRSKKRIVCDEEVCQKTRQKFMADTWRERHKESYRRNQRKHRVDNKSPHKELRAQAVERNKRLGRVCQFEFADFTL